MKKLFKKTLLPILISSSLIGCQKDDFYIKEEKEEKISEKVVQMNPSDLEEIVSIDEESISFSNKPKYKEGDIIVSGISSQTPLGLLREVTSVQNNKIKTQSTSLDEAIINGKIHYQKNFTINDLENIEKSSNSNFEFTKKFDKVIYDLDENLATIDDQIRIYGKFDFNCSQELSVNFENGVKEAYFLFSLQGDADVGLKGELNEEFNERKNLASLNFKPFLIPGAPIPIVAKPEIDLLLDVNGEVSGSFDFSVNSNFYFSCKPSYNNNSGWAIPIEKNLDFRVNEPDAELSAYSEISIGPRMTLTLNALVGPFMELKDYVNAKINLSENPWWELSAGVKADIGMDCGVLSKWIPEINKTIYKKDLVTLSADSLPMPNAILKADKKSGTPPLNVKFDGSKSTPKSSIEKYILYTNEERIENKTGEFSYQYNTSKKHWAILEVVDNIGRKSKDSLEIIVSSPSVEIFSDDGKRDTSWSFPGYCDSKYFSETSYIEKKLKVNQKPFYLEEIKIMFDKKATNGTGYKINIYDGEEHKKGINIPYDKPSLKKWYSIKLNEPVTINESLIIGAHDLSEPANCGDPKIHGWATAVDSNNSGESYTNITRITNNYAVVKDYKKLEGEFMIRAIGKNKTK